MAKRSRTDLIVVHCSATRPQMDIGANTIREWHISRGFNNVGYALVIRRNGLLEIGPDLDDVGAHVAGHNSKSIGLCLVGGLYADVAGNEFAGVFKLAQRLGRVDQHGGSRGQALAEKVV